MAAEPEQATGLSPERVAKLLESGEAQVIDVREGYEWDAGHIAGARHIELTQLTAEAETIDRDRPIVFHCRGDGRSALAVAAFTEAGYDAEAMEGGILAWSKHGLPLEPEDGEVIPRRPPDTGRG